MTLIATACGGDSPLPQPTPPPTPPPVVFNNPPVISQITLNTARAEAGREVLVSVFVTDTETPIERLSYSWSASPAAGSFIDSGPVVRWVPPKGQVSPDVYTLTVTITEPFTSAGQPQQHVVSASTTIRYNDSVSEISRLTLQFLSDFTTFEVSPQACVRNFTDTCRGKAAELADIVHNREAFHILGGEFFVQSVSLNQDLTFANVAAPCTFFDIPKGGSRERVEGICRLTAIYESPRWWLCESAFEGLSSAPFTVMGRALMKSSAIR